MIVKNFRFSHLWLWWSYLLRYKRCVFRWKSTNISEKHVVSIFRVWELAKKETSSTNPGNEVVTCLAYSSNLKLEATCSSETYVDFQQTTRRYIPEDGNRQILVKLFITKFNKNPFSCFIAVTCRTHGCDDDSSTACSAIRCEFPELAFMWVVM
jgi:PIN domain nuclease of toxin-antitoxin system